MQPKKTVLVAGGDLRYGYTARVLAQDLEVRAVGFTRQVLPFPEVQLASLTDTGLPTFDCLVLPIPVSEDGIHLNAPFQTQPVAVTDLIPLLKPGAAVFGGKFGQTAALFRDAGFTVSDYLAEEEMSTRNAVPTAEGAVQIMLEEMPCTLHGSPVLVLGFGRIGSRLAGVLHSLGAEVTVAARDVADRARAELYGCKSIPLNRITACAGDFSAVVNTIPAKVITAETLQAIQPDALILDLASKPGGVDWDAAQALSRRVVWALSLPGKTAPFTAGEIIAKTILHMLETDEGGVKHET